MTEILLTRDAFREAVFARDSNKCVNCKESAVDAHHIIERRLWPDSGYYLSNGASLCNKCHILAEQTILSAQQIREKLGIQKPILPPHLYDDAEYYKWGNILLSNGKRIKGELFFDESVQKIIQPVIELFIDYTKYPRTYHCIWSASKTNDDRTLESMDHFYGKEVVVTEKKDGENSSIYSDGYFHARSIDGNSHPSQTWLKNFIQKWFFNLPKGWKVCGENLYATHSIQYKNLSNYFQAFSIWNERNICLSWHETVEWCQLLGIQHVPVLYQGMYDEQIIKSLYQDKRDDDMMEGYVIRIADSFKYYDFKKSIAKYVRKGHIAETVHNWRLRWDANKINKLKIEAQ